MNETCKILERMPGPEFLVQKVLAMAMMVIMMLAYHNPYFSYPLSSCSWLPFCSGGLCFLFFFKHMDVHQKYPLSEFLWKLFVPDKNFFSNKQILLGYSFHLRLVGKVWIPLKCLQSVCKLHEWPLCQICLFLHLNFTPSFSCHVSSLPDSTPKD